MIAATQSTFVDDLNSSIPPVVLNEPETEYALSRRQNSLSDQAEITRMNNFVVVLKNALGLQLGTESLRTVFDGVYRTKGSSANYLNYGVNYIENRLDDLAAMNTVSFDSDKGVSMGSSNAYLRTNISPANGTQFQKDDGAILLYVSEVSASNSEQWYFGNRAASSTSIDRYELSYNRLSGQYRTQFFDSNDSGAAVTRGTGLIGLQRGNSSEYDILAPDGTVYTRSRTSRTESGRSIPFGNYDREGTYDKPMKDKISHWLVGNGSFDISAVKTAMDANFSTI